MSYNDNYYTNYDQGSQGGSDYSYRGYQDSGNRRYDDQKWAATDYGHSGGGYGKGTCLPLPDLCTLVALAGAVAVGAALAVIIPMLLMGKRRRRREAEHQGAVARTELTVFKGTSLSIVKDFIRREIDAFNTKLNVNSRVVATNNSDVKIFYSFRLGFMFCHSFIIGW